MRSHFAIACAALVVFATPAARGQRTSAAPDTITRPLDRNARAALINAVLADRWLMFAQPMLIERCYVARTLGLGAPPLDGIGVRAGIRFEGSLDGECERNPVEGRGDSVAIAFGRIEYEASEYIPMDRMSPRVAGLMVVRLSVLSGKSRSHTEEWVMRLARPGVWVVITVRMFAFGEE